MVTQGPGPKKPLSPKKPPKAAAKAPSPQAGQTSRPEPRALSVARGVKDSAQKIVLYGPGGVGKTELASLLAELEIGPVFCDLEEGSNFLDVARVEPTPTTFDELLAAIRLAVAMEECGAIVIDSFTKAEELAVAHTLRTVPHEKGYLVSSIESYGWGKGYVYVYETFLLLLQELDAAARKGKHIIGICHDCTANVPNPAGEDWIRYEPRLQSPPSGKGSIRHRVKEWVDHLLFVGFDTFVGTDGKAQGSGTRTIYPVEMPTHWAKSRFLTDAIVYEYGSPDIWRLIFEREREQSGSAA